MSELHLEAFPALVMIMGQSGRYLVRTTHDHENSPSRGGFP
jgi:hypothetical protein